jgi:hypothetical protein
LGLSTDRVDVSSRTSEVSVDCVDAVLAVLDDESLAVEPESLGSCPWPAPKDLARLEIAFAELLVWVKLDKIREKSRRRFLDSDDEIDDRS